ncbi:MAG: PEP-CTERM sorting domain-containing protein [Phycisphaeraceae bacterium]|nr:MAG: PEP-CTERM sorting domain-containing protein [Phycisphaeraceae bacterium]
MFSRNTIAYSMLGLFAAATGSASALAFGGSLSDSTHMLSEQNLRGGIEKFSGDIPPFFNPMKPDNPTIIPNDVGHTDQGPIGRPTGGGGSSGGGGFSPLMSTPTQPAPKTPALSSADLADVLGHLDLTIFGASDQPGPFTISETPPLLDIDAGSFGGGASFSAPTTPSFAIPAPGAIVLFGLVSAMAGARRRR